MPRRRDISNWEKWWKFAHTDLRFLPRGCEAAFELFHFMGMVGVSEARAEAVASMLKRYAPERSSRLSTDRIIEKSIVRNAGLNGLSADDLFLLRCWVEYLGGLQRDKFSFRCRWQAQARKRKFPLGGGSMTIHRHLKRQQQGKRSWGNSAIAMRELPRIGLKVAGASKWQQFLKREG